MMLQSDLLVKEKSQANRSNHFLETVIYKMNYCTKIIHFTQNLLKIPFQVGLNKTLARVKGIGSSSSFFISNANLLASTKTICPSELRSFCL